MLLGRFQFGKCILRSVLFSFQVLQIYPGLRQVLESGISKRKNGSHTLKQIPTLLRNNTCIGPANCTVRKFVKVISSVTHLFAIITADSFAFCLTVTDPLLV